MQEIRKNEKEILREEWHKTSDGGEVLLLKYPLLEKTGLVKHCFTTRFGGVSQGIFSSMNFSFTRGDARENVITNYHRLAEALGVEYENFVLSDQTHTTNVRKVTKVDAGKGLVQNRDYTDVDGLITNEPGLVLATFFADCVPLYFVDPVQRAIGMSHSGWRGTVERMGATTIAAMQREYGTRPEDLICAIGPSICQDCYEVSEDVAEQFRKAFKERAKELLRHGRCVRKEVDEADISTASDEAGKLYGMEKCVESAGTGKIVSVEQKYQLDLWKANEIVLTEAGVKRENIAVTNICTCCNPNLLFSHRASQGRRGNLGGFLCLV